MPLFEIQLLVWLQDCSWITNQNLSSQSKSNQCLCLINQVNRDICVQLPSNCSDMQTLNKHRYQSKRHSLHFAFVFCLSFCYRPQLFMSIFIPCQVETCCDFRPAGYVAFKSHFKRSTTRSNNYQRSLNTPRHKSQTLFEHNPHFLSQTQVRPLLCHRRVLTTIWPAW